MGIHSHIEPNLSVVLGTGEVSPLEMASAYSNFATNGRWAQPYLIERIEDASGSVLYQREPRTTQVGDPALFAAARQPLLKVPTSEGTAPRANIGRPQGGKTGTHQSFKDAWYVGFVPQFSTAVWVGYASEQLALEGVVINGERHRRVYGGTVPAPIWAEFMQIMLAGVEPLEFPADPPGVEAYLKVPQTKVPLVVGLTVEEATDIIGRARLNANVVEVASPEPAGTVVAQDPEPGASINEGGTVTIEVASGEPPVGALPSLIGLTFEEALEVVREFEEETGVRLSLSQESVAVDDPNKKGRIIATDPPPGTEVGYGVLVRVLVGS
jgi:membrane peptidoglycan carboxypeptidase